MKLLAINAIDSSAKLFRSLEKKGLIRMLRPDPKFVSSGVDLVYNSQPGFGSHKLICVRPESGKEPQAWLNSHPDNEEFILVGADSARFRPLYMLIGLSPHDELEEKAARGRLRREDLLLVRLRFNDPATCVFTMLANTAHCELVFPGPQAAPVFFVAEPSDLPMRFVKLDGYEFKFGRKKRNE